MSKCDWVRKIGVNYKIAYVSRGGISCIIIIAQKTIFGLVVVKFIIGVFFKNDIMLYSESVDKFSIPLL